MEENAGSGGGGILYIITRAKVLAAALASDPVSASLLSTAAYMITMLHECCEGRRGDVQALHEQLPVVSGFVAFYADRLADVENKR